MQLNVIGWKMKKMDSEKLVYFSDKSNKTIKVPISSSTLELAQTWINRL